MKGIHLRYLGDDVRAVEGVGVFQKGTVGFVLRDLAIQLIKSGDFQAVTNGPTAQAFIVRIGQDTIPSPDEAPPTVRRARGAGRFRGGAGGRGAPPDAGGDQARVTATTPKLSDDY